MLPLGILRESKWYSSWCVSIPSHGRYERGEVVVLECACLGWGTCGKMPRTWKVGESHEWKEKGKSTTIQAMNGAKAKSRYFLDTS